MTFPDIFKYIGWFLKYQPLLGRVLGNPDIRELLDAIKELGANSPANSTATLHETLVKHGVDTEHLANAIHPVGPQPEGPGLGANP